MKVSEILKCMGLEIFERYGIKWYTILNRKYAVDSFEPAYIKAMLGRNTKMDIIIISPALSKEDLKQHEKYLSKFFKVDASSFRTILSPMEREKVENDILLPPRPYPEPKHHWDDGEEMLEEHWGLISVHGTEGHRLFLEDLEAFYGIKSREINPDVGLIKAGSSDMLHFKLRSRWNDFYAEIWNASNTEGTVFIKQTSVNSDNRIIRVVLCPGSSVEVGKKVRKGQ